MTAVDSFERRKHRRAEVAVTVELRDERGFSLHSVRDLSGGGLFFDRAIPKPVGTRIQLGLTLPGDTRAIRCEGEIVNVPDRQGFGMGVRFLKLAPADEKRIDEFVGKAGS